MRLVKIIKGDHIGEIGFMAREENSRELLFFPLEEVEPYMLRLDISQVVLCGSYTNIKERQ